VNQSEFDKLVASVENAIVYQISELEIWGVLSQARQSSLDRIRGIVHEAVLSGFTDLVLAQVQAP
jgi:hypothetical protein